MNRREDEEEEEWGKDKRRYEVWGRQANKDLMCGKPLPGRMLL
jgi:hypothetical protein